MHAITVSECSMGLGTLCGGGGGGGNKLVKLVPGVHNAVKSGFFELYFRFCLSRTRCWRIMPALYRALYTTRSITSIIKHYEATNGIIRRST